MNKHEVELQRKLINAQNVVTAAGVIKHVLSLGAALWALNIIFDGLKPFIGQNPEAITAFAKLVAAINPSNITGYILAGVFGVGWHYERKGKQRAIEKKSEYQKLAESADPYRSSSGLTKTGQTPKEKAK